MGVVWMGCQMDGCCMDELLAGRLGAQTIDERDSMDGRMDECRCKNKQFPMTHNPLSVLINTTLCEHRSEAKLSE